MRVPTGDEVRYLDYTSLAYGARGSRITSIAARGIREPSPMPTAPSLRSTHVEDAQREFVSIAQQLQPLRSLGVYHAGMFRRGPNRCPRMAASSSIPGARHELHQSPTRQRRAAGILRPGRQGKKAPMPTHVMVVNLDYQAEVVVGIRGPSRLELFDPATGRWSRASGKRADLHLARGGGQLVRVRR